MHYLVGFQMVHTLLEKCLNKKTGVKCMVLCGLHHKWLSITGL